MNVLLICLTTPVQVVLCSQTNFLSAKTNIFIRKYYTSPWIYFHILIKEKIVLALFIVNALLYDSLRFVAVKDAPYANFWTRSSSCQWGITNKKNYCSDSNDCPNQNLLHKFQTHGPQNNYKSEAAFSYFRKFAYFSTQLLLLYSDMDQEQNKLQDIAVKITYLKRN